MTKSTRVRPISAIFATMLATLFGVICLLFLLALVNLALKRWLPARAFRPAEFADDGPPG